MATTLVIKKSNVAGKVPTTLLQGELAVNLKDEKLYTANGDGAIIELGGGAATPGVDPPDDKKEGDLWYDTDNNTLNFWNGSEWVEIGTAGDSPVISVNSKTGAVVLTAADVGALAAGDNVSELDNDAGYLDEAEVNNILNGLNPDGSPNPGSEGYLKPGDDVSELNNDAGYLTSADLPDDTLWLQGTGAIYPKELTDNVQVGGTAADPNIVLKASGSASFAGSVQSGGSPFGATADGIAFNAAGLVEASRSAGTSTIFRGYVTGNTTPNVEIRADGTTQIGGTLPSAPNISLNANGSAEFSSIVNVGNTNVSGEPDIGGAYVNSTSTELLLPNVQQT